MAEFLNHRLVERVHAVLHHADLPKSLWGEAVHFIIWIKNRVTTKPLGKITPHQQLYSSKPDLSLVPEWGQCVWVHQGSGSKLDGHAAEGQWVGFDAESTHAHKIYWKDRGHVPVERNVQFISDCIVVCPLPPIDPSPRSAAQPAPVIAQAPSASIDPASVPLPPPATSSREEEMPEEKDKEEEEVKGQLNMPGRLTIKIPLSMSKKQAQSIRRSARLVKPTQKAKDQVLLASDLDLEPLLADNEEEFIFHLQHDALISASIQDQVIDPRLIAEAHARTDWPL